MGNTVPLCCQQRLAQPTTKDQSLIEGFPFRVVNRPILNSFVGKRIQQLSKTPLVSLPETQPTETSMSCLAHPPMKQINKQYIYDGNWLANKFEGSGKIYFANQDYFQGSFRRGRAQGIGRYILSNGDYFEGQIKNNVAEGKGVFRTDQFEYQGMFKNSVPTVGTYLFRDKTRIQTYEVQNAVETEKLKLKSKIQAKILWPDGRKYKGQIEDLNPSGSGIMQFSNGNIYRGQFKEGMLHGKGIYVWSDGSRYEGQYKYGDKHGNGIFYWKSGKIYIGEWSSGLQDGIGKVFKNNKLIKQGLFQDGKFIGKVTQDMRELYKTQEKEGLLQKQEMIQQSHHKILNL